jgi:hypothetical protein
MKESKPAASHEVKQVMAIRVRPSTKVAMQKAAIDEARTINSLVEKIAIDWLKERGYLK